MSVAAIMWVFDDRDVLERNVRHLLHEVDEVLVRVRPGPPEVWELLEGIDDERLVIEQTDRFGYDQAAVMTSMGQWALQRGHGWVVPVDPDEVWYATGSRIADRLGELPVDIPIVTCELYNHVRTPGDPDVHPFASMGWRQRTPLGLPKVAARTHRRLMIHPGNHGARIGGLTFQAGPHLVARHFPYRSEDQFVERVRTNYAELKRMNWPLSQGAHIRHYGKCLEEEGEDVLREHFRTWFVVQSPETDEGLIYDPAPVRS